MKKNHVLLIFFIAFTNIYSQEKIFFSNNIHLFIANGEYELYYEAGGYNNEIKHFSPVVYAAAARLHRVAVKLASK